MGAQGNAPMCRGLGCVPGSMSRRRRAQLASYPGIARGGKTCPDGSSYPADVPCPPSKPPGGSGGSAVNPVFWLGSANPDWCKENPDLCSSGRPDPQKITMAINARGGKTCPDGSSYPADVPCPPAEPPGGSGGSGGSGVNFPTYYNSANPGWCMQNPGLCSNGRPDPRKIAMAVNGRGRPMGEPIASQRSRMQRRMRR